LKPFFAAVIAVLLSLSAVANAQQPPLGPNRDRLGALTPQRLPNGRLGGALPSSPLEFPPSLPPGPRMATQVLPSSADLTSQLPPVGDQGNQGSCVAWATGYYYKTFHEGKQRGWNLSDTTHQFSPSFLYNQRLYSKCQMDQGSTIGENMALVQGTGDVSLASFPYDDSDACSQPTASQLVAAHDYRAANYGAFFIDDRNQAGSYNNNLTPLKQGLADGNLVELAIPIYAEFYGLDASNCTMGLPSDSYIYGSHAIALTGYDDSTQRFKLRNSWGSGFGCAGDAYLSYEFMSHYVWEAWWMTDFTSDSLDRIFVPVVVKANGGPAAPGVYGQVLLHGSPLANAYVYLSKLYQSGGYWYSYTLQTTHTDSGGNYRFTGLASLANTEAYSVRFKNERRTPGQLWAFQGLNITGYKAGSNRQMATIDVADVSLGLPSGSITLPQTFYWTPRSTLMTDSYEWDIWSSSGDPWGSTNLLGNTSSFTLSDMPSFLSYYTDYFWDVWMQTGAGWANVLGAKPISISY
jgi:hypothetical protein